MERVALPVGEHRRWHKPALALLGALALAGALDLGGGSELLVWGIQALTRWPLPIAVVVGLYYLPGCALLRLLWPRSIPLTGAARATLALGISVALPPLLLLAWWVLRLPWGAFSTWAYWWMSLLLVVGFQWHDWRTAQRNIGQPSATVPTQITGNGWLLFGISVAALFVRLYTVRNLPTGLLGDSYHHTLMAQLLVDNHGIFHSWQPYAPLATFTYHFGFHANVAFVHYLSGVDVVKSVVWTGQILNAIIVPMLFVLVLTLGGSQWAGIWAALIAGFVSNLPAFYVNWGRYTQLTGQIVMISVVVCWITLIEHPAAHTSSNTTHWLANLQERYLVNWRLLLLTGLMTAAMILTHYLVTALAAMLIASYLLVWLLAQRSWHMLWERCILALPAIMIALVLATPWLLNVVGGHLVRNATSLVSASTGQTTVVAQLSTLEPLVPKYVDRSVLIAAFAGLLWAIWQRNWRMALPALWCLLLVISVVPYVVGLPGAGVIDHITGLGTLFLPSALLAANAIAAIQAYYSALLAKRHAPQQLSMLLATALVMLVIASNAGKQAAIASDETALVVDADMVAMQWIRENTDPNARFVVNSFPAYGGTLAAGSDAGWWLPLLAQRSSILPPLTYGSEQGEKPQYAWGVNLLIGKLRGHALTDLKALSIDLSRPVALRTLAANNIDYIYSGAHPYPGAADADRINTEKLRASPYFKLVYERDGVEIFQFIKNP